MKTLIHHPWRYILFARDSVCCKRAYAIAIPSLQLGTGKTAAGCPGVRSVGWLVSRVCRVSVRPAYARRQPRYQ